MGEAPFPAIPALGPLPTASPDTLPAFLIPLWDNPSRAPLGQQPPAALEFQGVDKLGIKRALCKLQRVWACGTEWLRLVCSPLSPSPLRTNVLRMISTSPESVSSGERFSLESKNIPSLFTKIWQYTEFKKINHSYNRFRFISFKGNSTNRSVKDIIHSCAFKILVLKTSLQRTLVQNCIDSRNHG